MSHPDWTFEPKLVDPRVHDRVAVVEVVIRLPLDAAAGGFVRYQRFQGEQAMGEQVIVLEDADVQALALEAWAKTLLETKGAIEAHVTATPPKSPAPKEEPALGGLGRLG